MTNDSQLDRLSADLATCERAIERSRARALDGDSETGIDIVDAPSPPAVAATAAALDPFQLRNDGMVILPAEATRKSPHRNLGKWGPWRANPPSGADIAEWVDMGCTTWCGLLGLGTRPLAVFDPEAAGMAHDVVGPVLHDLLDSLPPTCRVTSPGGSWHAWLRITDGEAPRSEQLAVDVGGKLLAELRGRNSVALIVSDGRRPVAEPFTPHDVTLAELDALLQRVRDVSPAVVVQPSTEPPKPASLWSQLSTTPEALAAALLDDDSPLTWLHCMDAGWRPVASQDPQWSYWLRPTYGEAPTSRHSAKGGDPNGRAVLVVHSSSVPWVGHLKQTATPSGSPGQVLAAARFGGDFAEAMRAVDDLRTGVVDERLGDWRTDVVDDVVARLPQLPAAVDLGTLEPDLFEATDMLRHLHTAARSRMVSPWAVLLCTLARVVAEIPPSVVLPPIIGSRASLNTFVVLIASSAGGKSTAWGCSADAVPILYGKAEVVTGGSGEGLIASFLTLGEAERKKPRPLVLKNHPQVLQFVDEVTQLGALKERSGSTITSTLPSLWSGSHVGNNNADPARRRNLPAHTYRLALVVGSQPANADVLLSESATGLPQRFVWARALPENLPDVEPDWPGEQPWTPPGLERGHVVGVPDDIVEHIKAQRKLQIATDGAEGLDGHAVQAREKLAAALAFLHSEWDINAEWWRLAGIIMQASDATREATRAVLAAAAVEVNRRKGVADAVRAEGSAGHVDESLDKAAAALWRTVSRHADGGREASNCKHEADEGCTSRCATYALRNHRALRSRRDDVIMRATELEWVTVDGDRYRVGTSAPAGGAR